jgi:hypothetical protein
MVKPPLKIDTLNNHLKWNGEDRYDREISIVKRKHRREERLSKEEMKELLDK